MRRQFKPVNLKEFENESEINKTSMKGEMRKLYTEINTKMKDCGWTANDVVAWFNKRDLPLTVNLFRIYLWEIDQEHGYKRSTDSYVANKTIKRSNKKVVMQSEKTAPANTTSETFSGNKPKHNLNKLITEMPDAFPMVEGWDELVAVGKESNNSSNTAQLEGKPKTFQHDPSPDKKKLF